LQRRPYRCKQELLQIQKKTVKRYRLVFLEALDRDKLVSQTVGVVHPPYVWWSDSCTSSITVTGVTRLLFKCYCQAHRVRRRIDSCANHSLLAAAGM